MNKKESDIVNPPVEDATYTAQYEIRTCTIKFYGLNNDILESYEDIERKLQSRFLILLKTIKIK